MVTILIGAIIGLLFGLAFGNDKPEKKSYTRKKKKWTPRHLPYKYNHLFR